MPSIDKIDAAVKEKVDTSFNREYTLGPKELKDIFPELKSEEDFSLIPLVDRITRKFIIDLKQNLPNYSILFFRYLGKDEGIPRCHYYEKGRIYGLVVGNSKHNRTVSINMHKIDVNPISNMDSSFSRRHYWMTDRATLKGNEHQVGTLSNSIREFIQRQNLEELIKESRQELEEIEEHRTETGFARPKEFHEFYFEEKVKEYENDIL